MTTGSSAASLAATAITRSVQNFSNNDNLDAYDGVQVWTRDPSLGWQEWTFDQISVTDEGTGIYTISSVTFPGTCITDNGTNAPVTLQRRDVNNLAQRWVVDLGQEETTIISEKNRDEVLQSNGNDMPVVAAPADGTPKQLWTLYNK